MTSRKLQVGQEEMLPLSIDEINADEETPSSEGRHSFLYKIDRGIFILGLELGVLSQGSTLPIQYITSFHPSWKEKLVLSLLWSYVIACVALFIFYFCQKVVHTFLLEVAPINHVSSPSKICSDSGSRNHTLEEWKMNIQINFVQGAAMGIFLSWVCVDMAMNFRINIIYSGIVFLLSLFLFSAQIWIKHKQQDVCSHKKSELALNSPSRTPSIISVV